MFTRTLYARWGDMDFNGHMKNTAYLDASGDVRMMFFSENGFSMREFERLRVGPVVVRDELEYFRELRLLEPVVVTLASAGMSEDGSRYRLRNVFSREDGKRVATVTSTGGWLDLERRRLTVPPDALLGVMRLLRRTEDFEGLASSVRE